MGWLIFRTRILRCRGWKRRGLREEDMIDALFSLFLILSYIWCFFLSIFPLFSPFVIG